MNDTDKQIIDRIEQVRAVVKLHKSQFSVRAGLAPQTYNNFVGAQASKPSVALVRGVAQAFGVSADWLLFGTGPMFRGTEWAANGAAPAGADGTPGQFVEQVDFAGPVMLRRFALLEERVTELRRLAGLEKELPRSFLPGAHTKGIGGMVGEVG